MSSQTLTEDEHFFAFDDDCTKCNEGALIKTRYDFEGIRQIVAERGGFRCAFGEESIKKIAHGALYKVFLLTSKTSSSAIMKITHPAFGPSEHVDRMVNSEAATMEFAKYKLNLPVPDVRYVDDRGYEQNPKGFSGGLWSKRDWSDSGDQENVVGDPDPWPYPVTKYLLVGESKGSRLSQAWQQLGLEPQKNVIRQILEFERNLASYHFKWHGSLYDDDGYDTESDRYKPIGFPRDGWKGHDRRPLEEYYMGPFVGHEALGTERQRDTNHHGPWESAVDYVKSVLQYEIDWISKYGSSPDVQIELLKKASSIVQHVVPKDIALTSARLHHPQLSFDNIFVDEEGQIESVIGWRGAWVGPTLAAQPPAAFEFGGHDEVLTLPEAFVSNLKSEGSEKEFDEISQQLLARTEEHRKATNNPISSLINVAMKTREFGTLPLRHFLIQVQRHWDRFETESPCPYDFTADEVKKHVEEVEGLKKEDEEKIERACLQVTRWLGEKAGGVLAENDRSEFRRCLGLWNTHSRTVGDERD